MVRNRPSLFCIYVHHNYASARQHMCQCIERDKKYYFFTSNVWKFKKINAKWRTLHQKWFHPIVLPSQPGIPLDIVMQYRPNMFQDFFFNVNLYFIGGTTVWFQDFSQLVQNSFKVAFELLSDLSRLFTSSLRKKSWFLVYGKKIKISFKFCRIYTRIHVTTFSKSVCYAL